MSHPDCGGGYCIDLFDGFLDTLQVKDLMLQELIVIVQKRRKLLHSLRLSGPGWDLGRPGPGTGSLAPDPSF